MSDDALAKLAEIPAVGSSMERVRHLKRGTEYEVLGEAEAQSSTGVRHFVDGRQVTVYRCVETGKLWVRFTDEFRDGRFETISTPLVEDTEGGGEKSGTGATPMGAADV